LAGWNLPSKGGWNLPSKVPRPRLFLTPSKGGWNSPSKGGWNFPSKDFILTNFSTKY